MLDALRRAVRRTDSWLNALTNVGLNSGRNAMLFRASARDYLDDITLEQLYELDGLAARIVRAPCVHALRRGFTVSTGDPAVDTAIKARLDELDAVNGLRRAWQWARLYGGGGVFIGADDGLDPREPLDESAIKSVRFAVDVDRIELIPQTWETDPLSARFGKPRIYQLVRNATGGGAQNASVHASRVIRFDGVEPTKRRRQTLQGWGDSVLQRVYVDLQQARGAYAAVSGLMHEASQGVFKMKDLMLMMAGDRDDTLKRRMEAMDMSRSVARAILIDADGESYDRVEVGSLTGLVEAMDRFTNMVSASSEIPVTVLMGQAPAGLNATGESDIRSWYDAVEAEREAMLRSRAERMVKLLLKSKDGPTGGVEPPGWKVTFPPLWQPTPSEEAELRSKVATTDNVYITAGVLTPEEVALNRFRTEGWSPDTTIDLEARESALKGGGASGEGETEGEDGEGSGGPAGAPTGAPPDHDAITSIIAKVAAREIPRDAGVQLLAAHVGERAELVMGEAGKSFFTTPEPGHAAELEKARAEAAAAKRSQMSAKAMLSRVLERNRAGELVVKPIGPAAEKAAEEIQPGDVVAVEEEPADAGEPAEMASGAADEVE
jgi:phage-related protein (TIGR01555 family)